MGPRRGGGRVRLLLLQKSGSRQLRSACSLQESKETLAASQPPLFPTPLSFCSSANIYLMYALGH